MCVRFCYWRYEGHKCPFGRRKSCDKDSYYKTKVRTLCNRKDHLPPELVPISTFHSLIFFTKGVIRVRYVKRLWNCARVRPVCSHRHLRSSLTSTCLDKQWRINRLQLMLWKRKGACVKNQSEWRNSSCTEFVWIDGRDAELQQRSQWYWISYG